MRKHPLLNPPIGSTAMVMGRETKAIIQGTVVGVSANGFPVVRIMIGFKEPFPVDVEFNIDGRSVGDGYSLISIIRNEAPHGVQQKP